MNDGHMPGVRGAKSGPGATKKPTEKHSGLRESSGNQTCMVILMLCHVHPCTEGVFFVFEMFIFVFEMFTLLCLNTKGFKRVESFGSQNHPYLTVHKI